MSENWKGTFLAVLALSYKATMTSGSYRFPSTPWHYGKAGATRFTIVRMAVFLSQHLYTSLKKKKEDCQMGEPRLSAWQRCYKSGVFCFKSENMRVNKKIIVWVSAGDWESKKTRSSRFLCFLVNNQTISTSGHWAHYKKNPNDSARTCIPATTGVNYDKLKYCEHLPEWTKKANKNTPYNLKSFLRKQIWSLNRLTTN